MSDLRVILVENGLSDTESLAAVCEIVSTISVRDDLERAIADFSPDAVVLDMRNPGAAFFQRLKEIQASLPTPIIIFSQDDSQETIAMAIEAGVAAYVVDSLQTGKILPILNTAIARFHRYRELELEDTRNRLSDRKRIERAKGIIMAQRKLSEDAAYSLMRKSAMEQNKRLVEIAANVISAADLLAG